MKIFNWAYQLFKQLDFSNNVSLYLNLIVNLVILIVVCYVLDFIFKKLFIIILAIVATQTKTTFDDFLVANKTAKYIAHLVPLLFIYKTVPVILSKFTYWEDFFEKGVKIYIIILSLWITRSIFNSLKDYLKHKPRFSDKPIDSYIQVIMIVLWIFGITALVLIMFNTTMKTLLTTFGAISALIFLIFKDTILGFVASIQVSVNDMVRIGDWITMDKFGADLMEHYETEMRSTHHLSRNTTSFYMRILRCVYRKAVGEGLALPADPFENVYTGVDKTSKRAATLTDIKHIKQLDLSDHKSLEFARDIFLFSFYMRGMSFIDLAYLRKKDLNSGFVSYSRRKTGKKLIIRWEKQMQEIIDRYGDSETQYLLPIIEREDGTERRQYRNKMLLVNRKLKKIAARAGLTTPLTMYVARHKWEYYKNSTVYI